VRLPLALQHVEGYLKATAACVECLYAYRMLGEGGARARGGRCATDGLRHLSYFGRPMFIFYLSFHSPSLLVSPRSDRGPPRRTARPRHRAGAHPSTSLSAATHKRNGESDNTAKRHSTMIRTPRRRPRLAATRR
jgi:hypothetical protein